MPALKGPLVSIGIPVFNKEAHLAATLDSALAQEHANLEVILADNGSTDRSADICREYCARDARVRFVQNRYNLGSRRNFNFVFELARGEYFAWGRGHDVWAPGFLSRGLAILTADPEVVLFHARCRELDANGVDLGPVAETLDTRGRALPERLMAGWRELLGPATLGLMRTAAMERTRLYQNLAGTDIVFLLELAVTGAFAFVDEPLLALRRTRVESSEDETVLRTWAQMDPFRAVVEPPANHVLDFTQRHLQVLRELPLPALAKDDLLTDLIATYGEKFKGSFTRALDMIAERVQAAAMAASPDAPEVLDCATAMSLLDRLNLALLFQRGHPRATEARDLLLELILGLTAPMATP